jgi:hypothetical protein
VCDLETSRIGAPYIYDISNLRVKMDGCALKQVSKFKYLGSIITEDGKNREDIMQRIRELKLRLLIKINYYFRITLVWK